MDKKLQVLLRDFGYRMAEKYLIDKGVEGFIPPKVIGKFNSFLDAVEYLIPVIHDEEFHKRYNRIVTQ